MKKLVTISRQYGSGGRIIGKLLADKLGVPFYDKEIIGGKRLFERADGRHGA